MSILRSTLANLIMRGKVTVDIPGINEDTFRELLRDSAVAKVREAEGILEDVYITDQEKLIALRELLL